jgi:hypothetical protein
MPRTLSHLPFLSLLAVSTLALAACTSASSDPTGLDDGRTAVTAQALTRCLTIQRGTLGAVEDTTITSSITLPGWSSTSTTFHAGGTYESLLKFDVSAIPAGAVVTSATLGLTTTTTFSSAYLSARYANAFWSEATASWASFNQQTGSFLGSMTPSAANTLQTLSLKPAAVQGWRDGTLANNGIVLETGITNRPPDAWKETIFVSSESPTVALRPKLDVCYTPVDYCAPAPCQNGATCTSGATTYTCACAPGFTGANCQTNIDDCAGSPCQNGGACTDGVNSYTCACAPGYTGSHCQTDINECAPAPCQNGATCTDQVNAYACTCLPGFSGTNCQTNIDDCAGSPCQNGGACTDGVNSYTCACAPGFTGAQCQINTDDCVGNACQNGSACVDGIASYTCACAPGFTGARCQTNIDDCAGGPCQNGGACADGVNSYTCACAPGYTGTNCQIDINDCAPNPCLNGGTCMDGVNSYTCQCPAGFSGTNCENVVVCPAGYTGPSCDVDIDECAGGDPCNLNNFDPVTGLPMGVACTNTPGSYTCQCAPGAAGAACDVACPCIDAAWGADPYRGPTDPDTYYPWLYLQLGVSSAFTCATTPAGTTISTQPPSGTYSQSIDTLFLGPTSCAGNLGTAYALTTPDQVAACQSLFANATCFADQCAPSPCQNGGTCVTSGATYTCQCPVGWTGTNCDVDVDECASGDPCNLNTLELGNSPMGASCTNTVGGYTCECSFFAAGASCEIPCPCIDAAVQAGDYPTGILWFYTTLGIPVDACTTSPSDTKLDIAAFGAAQLVLTPTSCSVLYGGSSPSYALTAGQHAACQGIFDNAIAVNNLTCNPDHCAPGLCQNGGACLNSATNYTCQCTGGFVGTNCEIDPCAAMPCQNGGTCAGGGGGYTCGCPAGFTGTNCEQPVIPMDFGGMYGFVEGVPVANPATGASSCPAGYTATAFRSAPGFDDDGFYCWRGAVAGEDPVYDFGGMWGYVENQLAVNSLTGGASCPAGYTDLKVEDGSGYDYPLHVCYQPHVAGTTPRRLGGMFGAVNNTPTNNVATGDASCPAGYTDNQVLGSSGIDYPVHYCYQGCPVGLVGNDCDIPVTPMDFGGMYGFVEGVQQANPATGASSCPAGYTATAVLDNPGFDYAAYYCWRGHLAGQEPVYDFGGMWGYVEGQPVSNPSTGASSCPAGYTDQRVSGTSGSDYEMHVCYQPHVAGTTAPLLGGMYGAVGGHSSQNPATGAASCPVGYTAVQVLGTSGIDSPVYYCYHACPAGFAGALCEVSAACAGAPCQHGGTCTASGATYTCQCPVAWTGTDCEVDVDECATTDPCTSAAGGTCTNTVGGYACTCPVVGANADCGACTTSPPPACRDDGDLSNVGSGDFRVQLTLTTTQTGSSYPLFQRATCGNGMFWDLVLQDGLVAVETDDGTPGHYTGFFGSSMVNDGQPHVIVIERQAGQLHLTIDCVMEASAPSPAVFTQLPPLTFAGLCSVTDFQGTLGGICLARVP